MSKPKKTPPVTIKAVSTFTVYVNDFTTSDPIEGACVHLDPRASGLDYPEDKTTGQTGQVQFMVEAGRYDVEVSHPEYYDDCHLKEMVSAPTDSTTFYLEELP